jgi:hypothetical protein
LIVAFSNILFLICFSSLVQETYPVGNSWSSFITHADTDQKTIFNFCLGGNHMFDQQKFFPIQGIEARNVIYTIRMEMLRRMRNWKELQFFLFKSYLLRAVSHLTLIVTVSINQIKPANFLQKLPSYFRANLFFFNWKDKTLILTKLSSCACNLYS